MPINAEWHRAHPMPKNATLEQRAAWHVEHAQACACREMPASIRRWIEEAGGAAPQKRPGRAVQPSAARSARSRPRG